jgi:hypothetical protein
MHAYTLISKLCVDEEKEEELMRLRLIKKNLLDEKDQLEASKELKTIKLNALEEHLNKEKVLHKIAIAKRIMKEKLELQHDIKIIKKQLSKKEQELYELLNPPKRQENELYELLNNTPEQIASTDSRNKSLTKLEDIEDPTRFMRDTRPSYRRPNFFPLRTTPIKKIFTSPMLQVLSDKSPDPDALKKVVIDIISGSQRSESVKSQPASQSEEITQTKNMKTKNLSRIPRVRSLEIPRVRRLVTRSKSRTGSNTSFSFSCFLFE